MMPSSDLLMMASLRRLDNGRQQASGTRRLALSFSKRRRSVMSRKTSTLPTTLALLVPDRGGTVVDGPLGAVLGDQDGVVRQPDDRALLQRTQGRVLDRLAGVLVDDAEHFLERLALGVLVGPARSGLRPPGSGTSPGPRCRWRSRHPRCSPAWRGTSSRCSWITAAARCRADDAASEEPDQNSRTGPAQQGARIAGRHGGLISRLGPPPAPAAISLLPLPSHRPVLVWRPSAPCLFWPAMNDPPPRGPSLFPHGDTLFQQGQAFVVIRLQLPDVVLLLGVVLGLVF